MSYDLMVFEEQDAPKEHAEFMRWFQKQAEWSEDHSYEDPKVSSIALQSWYREMIEEFPPLNGPNASDDIDNPKLTDHCIGKSVIYSAFSWECAEEAYKSMRTLAQKHKVGFFDASGDDAEVVYSQGPSAPSTNRNKPWWKFW